jgi:hypothetical protein
MTTTIKDHTTYDAQGRAHTAPGCGTDAKAGDEAARDAIELRFSGQAQPSAATNDELVRRPRIEFGTDPDPDTEPAPTPLVKLGNGREITPSQVSAWNGREFATGVACGLAIGAVVLVIVHMIWPLI